MASSLARAPGAAGGRRTRTAREREPGAGAAHQKERKGGKHRVAKGMASPRRPWLVDTPDVSGNVFPLPRDVRTAPVVYPSPGVTTSVVSPSSVTGYRGVQVLPAPVPGALACMHALTENKYDDEMILPNVGCGS